MARKEKDWNRKIPVSVKKPIKTGKMFGNKVFNQPKPKKFPEIRYLTEFSTMSPSWMPYWQRERDNVWTGTNTILSQPHSLRVGDLVDIGNVTSRITQISSDGILAGILNQSSVPTYNNNNYMSNSTSRTSTTGTSTTITGSTETDPLSFNNAAETLQINASTYVDRIPGEPRTISVTTPSRRYEVNSMWVRDEAERRAAEEELQRRIDNRVGGIAREELERFRVQEERYLRSATFDREQPTRLEWEADPRSTVSNPIWPNRLSTETKVQIRNWLKENFEIKVQLTVNQKQLEIKTSLSLKDTDEEITSDSDFIDLGDLRDD
jgi:hypothetical protein